jgi:small subunit ribosomal protein S20
MANTKQSKKRILQTAVRTERNAARMNRIRTFIRKVTDSVTEKNKEASVEALRLAQIEIMKGVSKGVLHKNTAARKVSRLACAVKKICLATAA